MLIERGHEVAVPDLRACLHDAPDVYEVVARLIANDAGRQATVVMHSGAGALAPCIWGADNRLTRMIFLDALLPHPGLSWFETLPTMMADRLRAASADGFLPPWPGWWAKGVLEQLVPDIELRRTISAEARGVPLSYVMAKAPRVLGWEQSAVCNYVQLSDGYEEQAQAAAKMGLTVDRFHGNHLSMVSAPASVADLLMDAAPQ